MKDTRKTQSLMILAAFFWAGAFIAGKKSSAEIPPISLTFFRMFFAFIGITLVRWAKKDNSLFVEKKDMPYIIGMAITGMIGYHILFFYALRYTTATNTSIIAATNPIITIIFGAIMFKERVKLKNCVGVALSFIGIIIIFTGGNLNELNLKHFGDLIMLFGVIMWVVYSFVSKKMLNVYSPYKITALIFGIAALILLPFSLFEFFNTYQLSEVSTEAWLSVLYMAIFPSVIGYLIQQVAIKNIGNIKTAQFVNLVPVFSMILAYFILGERVGLEHLTAFTLIFIGILINNWN